MGVPAGGLAFTLGEMPVLVEAETLPDPSFGEHYRTVYRPPGLAAQSGGAVIVTRTITYILRQTQDRPMTHWAASPPRTIPAANPSSTGMTP